MGSRDKFYGVETRSHGIDDVGVLQTAGTINSVAKYGAGKWAKYALVTASAAHNLTMGQSVNILGTTDYDGPTRVVATPSTTTFVIKRPFTITKTGTWDGKAAEGNWDAFMPMHGDMAAAGVTFVYWRPEQQGGLDGFANFTKDVVYKIPGGLKTVTCATAATSPTAPTLRLIRASSVRPGGLRNPSAPGVVGYLPTGATAGETIDILGKNFDPALSNNVVQFYNGTTGTVAYPSAVNSEGDIITVVVPSGVGATGIITVKTNGMATASGPAFNGH